MSYQIYFKKTLTIACVKRCVGLPLRPLWNEGCNIPGVSEETEV
jgi:hypothetical protein